MLRNGICYNIYLLYIESCNLLGNLSYRVVIVRYCAVFFFSFPFIFLLYCRSHEHVYIYIYIYKSNM